MSSPWWQSFQQAQLEKSLKWPDLVQTNAGNLPVLEKTAIPAFFAGRAILVFLLPPEVERRCLFGHDVSSYA